MKLQTEIFISTDGENYYKIDPMQNESIDMKFIFKDTTDLSKIFSPFSLSFTFPGTLNNQRIFDFIGNTKISRTKSDYVFPCKIYSNGLLYQTGKLKVTEIRYEKLKVKSFTANFTTSLLSLKDRMGDDLINNLPINPITMNWLPNEVFESVKSVRTSLIQPMDGINVKYYVPLISNSRVFQRITNTQVDYLDNVAFDSLANPLSTKVLKADELTPAIQFRTIIDLIIKKYNLEVIMPLQETDYYNDAFIYCNTEKINDNSEMKFDLINSFGSVIRYDERRPGRIPTPGKYSIIGDVGSDTFQIRNDYFAGNNFDQSCQVVFVFKDCISTKGEAVEANLKIVKSNGSVFSQNAGEMIGNDLQVPFTFDNTDFDASGNFTFNLFMSSKTPLTWSVSNVVLLYKYYDENAGGGSTGSAWASYKQESLNNNNALTMGASKIDLFKSLPETKCSDFLMSFFKTFNISVFDSSPNDEKLFWLTPKDLEASNKEYSKKEVDYTPYIVSRNVNKKRGADFNYYNFKHLTSKYKSNVDYLSSNGYELGQLTYPTPKPTIDLNEFKVETTFSIFPAVPIAGMTDEFTSYAFTSDPPEILTGGEKRYKPNYNELTIFFACGIRNLTGNKALGFQKTNISNALITSSLTSYVKTSPVHTSGFSLGFGLIQEAVVQSLYYNYYKTQTERLLNPNALQETFELELPASELVLNYATTGAGMSQVPDGFRLQNEPILQEQRYSIIDAQIDITTGKTNITLLTILNNYVIEDGEIVPPTDPEPEPDPDPVLETFYYEGIYEEGDEVHSSGGTVKYYDAFGNIQTQRYFYSGTCTGVVAVSIISSMGCLPCEP